MPETCIFKSTPPAYPFASLIFYFQLLNQTNGMSYRLKSQYTSGFYFKDVRMWICVFGDELKLLHSQHRSNEQIDVDGQDFLLMRTIALPFIKMHPLFSALFTSDAIQSLVTWWLFVVGPFHGNLGINFTME